MSYDVLSKIKELRDDPVPLLNMPLDERIEWENALFDVAEILEDFRVGVLVIKNCRVEDCLPIGITIGSGEYEQGS